MIEIRKAKIEDVEILKDFQKQLYGEWFDAGHSNLTQSISLGYVWLAVEAEKIVGYQLCELFGSDEKNFPNSIFLSELFVVPEFRNKGVGTRLVETTLNEPWPTEFQYYSLTHDPDELFLTKYYEKFGFKECGKTDVGNIKMTRPRILKKNSG